jgi:ketosteroid isomerase-like protein
VASRAEILRAVYDAWNREDFEGLEKHLHPEIEWRSSSYFPGLEPLYSGREAVRGWWEALREPFDSWTIDLDEMQEVEGRIVTFVCFHAIGKGSGVAVDLPFAHVFEFEGDLIRRYRSFESADEALAAARSGEFAPPAG